VTIKFSDKFLFEGAIQVRVLEGRMTVFGRELNSKQSDWIYVVSDP
jgi:hypothetical protein